MKTNFTTFLAIVALVFFAINLHGQNQLNGEINYHNDENKPIEGVYVELFDDANNLIATSTTNSDGEYTFTDLPDGTYTVVPSADFNISGDGLQDAFLVLMHIMGFNNLTGLQFMAGDVDENNQINMMDYVIILIDWLTGGNPPPGEAWEFETATITLAKTSTLKSGGTSDVDVDGSWSPGVKPDQSVQAFYSRTIEMQPKTDVEIPLQINTEVPVGGLNLLLEFPSEYLQISSVNSSMGDLNYSVNNNILSISWMDVKAKNMYDPQITIHATTSRHFVGENKISLSVLEKSHLIDSKGHSIDQVKIEMPEYNSINNTFSMGELYPNPTSGVFNIDYEMEESGTLTMDIYGMNGQHIATHKINNQYPGIYQESLDANSMGLTPGIYSVRISLNESANITTKKLLVTK